MNARAAAIFFCAIASAPACALVAGLGDYEGPPLAGDAASDADAALAADDRGSEGVAPSEAGDGGTVCVPDAHLLCEDFEQPGLDMRWTKGNVGAAMVTRSQKYAHGGAWSAQVFVPPEDGGGTGVDTRLSQRVGDVTRVRCTFAVRLVAGDVAPSHDYITLVDMDFGDSVIFNLFGDGVGTDMHVASNVVQGPSFGAGGGFHLVTLEVDRRANQVTLWVDDDPDGGATYPATDLAITSALTFRVGANYVPRPNTLWEVYVDDIVCDGL